MQFVQLAIKLEAQLRLVPMQQTRDVRHHKYSGGAPVCRESLYIYEERALHVLCSIRSSEMALLLRFFQNKGSNCSQSPYNFVKTLFLENHKCQLCGVTREIQQITKVMATIHPSI